METNYLFECACGQRIRVKEEHIGMSGKCAGCGNRITVTRESLRPTKAAEAADATVPVDQPRPPSNALAVKAIRETRSIRFDEFAGFFDEMVAKVRGAYPERDAYQIVKKSITLDCPQCGRLTTAAVESIYIAGSIKGMGNAVLVGLGPNVSGSIEGRCPKCGGTTLVAAFEFSESG